MKRNWERFAARIDGLTLRERALVFGAVVAGLLFLVYYSLLDPLYARQRVLFSELGQKQTQMLAIDGEIGQKLLQYAVDPDAANQTRLARSKAKLAEATETLSAMQAGMVSPEKMIPLLQQLLRVHDRLRLQSMKTLPVSGLSEAADPAARLGGLAPGAAPAPAVNSAAAPASKPAELMYRHGVEIVVQGAYPDLVAYMAALEALPTRLLWGQARLEAGQYPGSTLTLTVYTLGLDKKWITL